jgi:hypothetical protein
MGRFARALVDHFKEVVWAVFLIFLFLGCLFVIFGRHLGYDTIGWICLGFGVIVTGVFTMIILGNLLCIAIGSVFKRLISKG